ncbi:hypothetical protein RvY_11825 [Ramazzottius varieornatus]|uniref:Uncharacterized protein n=1 Tax=Ramazzottius varieornatus TaxID=947166 RepID=A0A1D1VQ33_RAMVA|nr:hypothetical protein RvY_11825 [Ramazzottius varieornatus]
MERARSLRRNVSFRARDVNTAFERRDSSRRKKTLMGKLTSMVQDIVADEEEVKIRLDQLIIHEALLAAVEKLAASYETVLSALTHLHAQYGKCTENSNFYQRYASMKIMIKQVLRAINQIGGNKTCIRIPAQEPGELPLAYAQRLVPLINQTKKASTESDDEAKRKADKELKDRFDGVTLEEINQENEILHSDLYQMARRYCGLRKLIDMLERDYKGVKHYPFFLRYAMLKGMLMDLKRNPAFIEVCSENINNGMKPEHGN